ncbi:MAG: HD domain-containing protein [Lachnospiraceae bacterium]|nr:HD domain-containing protein [Lachnospiraceae bacterium]
MKKSDIRVVLYIFFSVAINIFGGKIATALNLPIWGDTFGTIFSAYVFGPFVGALVGMTTNIIFAMLGSAPIAYMIVSVFIGVIVGFAARKGMFDSLYGTISVSVVITFGSLLVAVPLDFILYKGMTGNIWGNGVIGFLAERGVSKFLRVIIGQFYIEFIDKVGVLILMFVLIKLRRGRLEYSKANLNGFSIKNIIKKRFKKDVASVLIIMLSLANLLPAFSNNIISANAIDSTTNTYISTIYGSNNGLPCGEANDVVQTNDGVLWVGTYAGLYRYTGTEFRLMSEYDTVRNVNCLYKDEDGRLFIGTNDNGVSVNVNENIIDTLDVEGGLSSNSIRSIIRGEDGYYYIGTSLGLDIVTLNAGFNYVKTISSIKYACSATINSEGYISVVDTDGRVFVLRDGEIVASTKSDDNTDIYTCTTFIDDVLYVGTAKNHVITYTFDGDKLHMHSRYTCKEMKNINRLYQVGDNVYVCSDSGIGYLNKSKRYIHVNTGEFNNSVDNMMVDYQGNMWFTSSRLGLLKMSESSFMDVYRTAGMDDSVVNSTLEWNGTLYSGTDTGLEAISADRKSQIHNFITDGLEGVRIRCLTTDKQNNMWICTYGSGVICVDKDLNYTTFDNSNPMMGSWTRVVRCLEDGTIVVGSEEGVSFIKNETVTKCVTAEGALTNTMILSIEQLSDGRILCGTDGDGIVVLESDGSFVKRITRENGLSSGVILRTIEDSHESGVFIVASNGLSYMDSAYDIRELDNFPYYNNYDALAIADGELCILSSSGVFIVDESKLIAGSTLTEEILLDVKKGLNGPLIANSWNYIDNYGKLYLSCEDGIYMLDTTSYDTVKKSYRMRLSDIKVDNKDVYIERGEDIIIDSDSKKLTLYPEVINYSLENPYISYYLEGVDEEPTVCRLSDFSSVSYSNISSGSYRFYISILDSNTDKVIESNSFSIIKEAHIYNHGYFMIYFIIVAALAITWLTWFIARIRLQRTLAIQKIHIEMAEKQLQMGNQTILAIAKAVDAKDVNTSQHSRRVSEYSVMIAKRLGMSDEECDNIRKSALLHDIGKIGIPDRILNKPDRLTDDEYAIMKSHVTRGAEILREFTLVDHIIEGALYHHEKYDGTGYASGLKGKEIPLYGRIIGVADAFDAMTANRIYRKKLDFDFVINELKRCRGTQFDPEILDVFLELIEDGTVDVEELYHRSVTGNIIVENPATPNEHVIDIIPNDSEEEG